MSVNLLLSYALNASVDLAAVRTNLVCGQMMIDSGAFTAHSSGRPIELGAYAWYLERWRGHWDHAITLDVIGDPAATRANTRKLHDRGLPVMPVFTRGDSLAEFDAMVREVGYVCVGGLVGMPGEAQAARVGMLQRRAERLGGGIHALGVGALSVLRRARPYSADASNISVQFRYGGIAYFDGRDVRQVTVADHAAILRAHRHLMEHEIDLAPLVRAGRLPSKAGGRQDLMKAMSLSYAAADEALRQWIPVPPPVRFTNSGPHLFSSVSGNDYEGASAADAHLHGRRPVGAGLGALPLLGQDPARVAPWNPPIWRRWGSRHVCRRRGLTDAA
ncbi:hypothetical protein CcI49_23290 [Frankia sp. CcI49]|uniref:hypothetical protein n=1 Tax=Frankia sp. CcI49 TaxID=1745382 RepID=UPI0009787DDB|nr:hypothetical protein [Frankia sp. CcI49]ONH58383.1 hypothetical protein CcI49_23290 [Frankia sp. CcI49]